MKPSGLYIHIPFCKSKCYYCDFFSVTSTENRKELIDALAKELRKESSFLDDEKPSLRTIYFGGGTPSLLDESEFELLFRSIADNYDISNCEEITVEANPDDLSEGYIMMLRDLPFNRISIGIQSFDNDELKAINRRHDACQAIKAVEDCYRLGFENISIDLMYGLPGQTMESFYSSTDRALSLPVKHISSYALSWEKGSVLYGMLQSGKLAQASDEFFADCYSVLNRKLTENKFERYELSNFSLPGYRSKHNSSYWSGTSFLGIGPGAHSYNGSERRMNVESIEGYILGMSSGNPDRKSEFIDENTKYNEFIMTRLRTTDGFRMGDLEKMFGISKRYYCLKNAEKSIQNGCLLYEDGVLRLAEKGLFIADSIISDLIWA